MESWRNTTFKEGQSYQVKQDFSSQISVFKRGEMLVYQNSAYSTYDSSSAFIFKSSIDSEIKTFFLHDDDSDNSSEFFEEIIVKGAGIGG